MKLYSNKTIFFPINTGIVRSIDDLCRIVIPKESRRTLRIREGEPSHTTLTQFDKFCFGVHSFMKRYNT